MKMDIKGAFVVVVLQIMLIILFKDLKIEQFGTIKEQSIDIITTSKTKISKIYIIIDKNQNQNILSIQK
jgi:hypothetical protein